MREGDDVAARPLRDVLLVSVRARRVQPRRREVRPGGQAPHRALSACPFLGLQQLLSSRVVRSGLSSDSPSQKTLNKKHRLHGGVLIVRLLSQTYFVKYLLQLM